MKKKIIIINLLVLVLFMSCEKNTEKLNSENESLKRANDSLLDITNQLKNKFIFDQASIRLIPSEKNSNKLGSFYEGTFVIIAYNKSDKVLFSEKLSDTNSIDLNSLKSGIYFLKITSDKNVKTFKVILMK